MATPASIVTGPKKSFASVAAMAPPTQVKQSATRPEDKVGRFGNHSSVPLTRLAPKENLCANRIPDDLSASISRLELKNDLSASGEPTGLDSNGILSSDLTLGDEKTHLSYSSTKPPSLDGKSVASGTTFAMDEKESLRPDDSASLKAVEEDDSNSGHASGAPSSRIGSEAGGKAFRDQFNEISQIGPSEQRPLLLNQRILQGNVVEVPQGPLAAITATVPAAAGLPRPDMVPISGTIPLFNYQEPDEKLLEAMESPKDRLFLLQLEQQVITFIRDSQDAVLDLPPCNSFCRLLAHRLGDYYALTHYVDNAVSAVKLYRTPYCRLPNPLSNYSRQQTASEGSSSAQPSMKIMRRAGLGLDNPNESGPNTAASSLGPSKAGSETGDESQRVSGVTSPTDSTIAKDKSSMTREEREAKYKETRERIFGGVEDTQATEVSQMIDPVNETSRTSSASGKKKSKRNKNNDDDFEARSSYNAYWPAVQYPGTAYTQPTNPVTYFNPYMQQPNGQAPQAGMTQAYNQPYQTLPQQQPYQMPMPQASLPAGPVSYPQNFAYTPNTGQQPHAAFPQQMPQQYYPAMPQQQQMIPPSPGMSSPALSNNGQLSRPQSQMFDQHWSQPNFQNPSPYPVFNGQQLAYQTHVQPQMLTQPTTANASPYPYGQLPFQSSPQSARSQHPLPGSYNRQAFNPQTRAFVPGIPSFVPPQQVAYTPRPAEALSYRSNPSFPTPSGIPAYVQQPASNLQLPHMAQPAQYIQMPMTQPYTQPQTQRKASGQSTRSQSPGKSTLSKWARPENLPPKPPPSEASSKTSNGFQHGQGMPKFQNGTYSKPNTGSQVN